MAVDRQQIEDFIYMEARLQDEQRYDEWDALWTDDAVYWVPANGDDIDPGRQVSIINDNRPRIATRVAQLQTDVRHSQVPPSRMRRLISNIEIEEEGDENGDITVGSNFILIEHRMRRGMVTWAGRTVHKLRPDENGDFKMSQKKVMLVNNYGEVPTMAFLI
jgi:3-phenylpropionate/cinnamic acid dioxygenase small subunit